jgi:hypothetical protein
MSNKSSITPTIGRKVWFWASEDFIDATDCVPEDPKQAFDATVIYVHSDGNVNLSVVDHRGEQGLVENCELRDPGEGDEHGGEEDYATWMPYQMGQAAKKEPSA